MFINQIPCFNISALIKSILKLHFYVLKNLFIIPGFHTRIYTASFLTFVGINFETWFKLQSAARTSFAETLRGLEFRSFFRHVISKGLYLDFSSPKTFQFFKVKT